MSASAACGSHGESPARYALQLREITLVDYGLTNNLKKVTEISIPVRGSEQDA